MLIFIASRIPFSGLRALKQERLVGGLAGGSDRADREWLYPRKAVEWKGGTSGSSAGEGTSAR